MWQGVVSAGVGRNPKISNPKNLGKPKSAHHGGSRLGEVGANTVWGGNGVG